MYSQISINKLHIVLDSTVPKFSRIAFMAKCVAYLNISTCTYLLVNTSQCSTIICIWKACIPIKTMVVHGNLIPKTKPKCFGKSLSYINYNFSNINNFNSIEIQLLFTFAYLILVIL